MAAPPAVMAEVKSVPERLDNGVQAPPLHPLPHNDLFKGNKVQPEVLRLHLLKEGKITEDDVCRLCKDAMAAFRAEPNIIKLEGNVNIVGDIHGQYYDLMKVFEIGGKVEEVPYLFLGDYVDRGTFSCEVVLYLMALKSTHPKKVFCIRGNHECRALTRTFNFKNECLHKYSMRVYDAFMDVFDTLPLCALLDAKFLCCHGGIGPSFHTLEDINRIDRFSEPPEAGPMCDLLWADPTPDEDDEVQAKPFTPNTTRGCSYLFNSKAALRFLKDNQLLSIVRAHEAQKEGFKMHKKDPENDFPAVITLFSAPNYCDVYKNKAAILKYQNTLINIRQFKQTQHPYCLPNFMNVFTWSLPFVGEKMSQFLSDALLMADLDAEFEDDGSAATSKAFSASEKDERRRQIKAKVKAMAKFVKTYEASRLNNEELIHLGGLADRGITQHNMSAEARAKLMSLVQNDEETEEAFLAARSLDSLNEKRPMMKKQ
ncbi:hypothetical protein KFE25_014118 [Diacronema lutheri]|uniref:Serine/threonine-protein phosphatase n=1 Tax=Diacronema lutheri TaxID=2081491 RepID=A0A8J5X4M6_DIALT|nr:hypothetical protein KFE25_014118 [Diacronema lutheri]